MCDHGLTPTKVAEQFGVNAVEDVKDEVEKVAKTYGSVINRESPSYEDFVDDMAKSVIDVLATK